MHGDRRRSLSSSHLAKRVTKFYSLLPDRLRYSCPPPHPYLNTSVPMMSSKPRQRPTLKKLRCLVLVCLVFLSVLLFVRSFRFSDLMNVQLWTQPYPEQKPEPVQTEATAAQEQVISFAPVENTKTLLLSAYQEHRTNKKEVRVIAVVLRSEKAAYRCVFYCQEQQHVSEGVSHIHIDHFNFSYGTADIMCPVPSGCEAPTHITVKSAANFSQDTTHRELLEIRNQVVQSDQFAFDFTVCFSTMFNFTNVLQLVQSLTMLQLLGVNRVVIYKTDCSPEIQRLLDYYIRKGFVELIPWSLSKYMYKSRYVAMNDVDELILPQRVNRIISLKQRCLVHSSIRCSSSEDKPDGVLHQTCKIVT
ncbi:hypothetical protein OJAV_G00134160 [Oryzias javanicus]|uniref:Glycosyltransferase family 92 protein n=1 Tax=Oryzias javanicus TaxID=123683 RepID=A0A437CSE6_ORYJA|nr:hypothetical protein OJAV_G00134160 [Oryzias javanicus]